ncbi:MAG: tail fiber domain-containing protein, partial [Candidatus Hinthialibacter sp.]
YRGHIADKPGTQNFQINFKLYNQAQGGDPVWTETHPSVDLFDGNFAVILGPLSESELGLFSGDPLYLAVQVEGESELTPRQQITSVPYAFNSALLDGKDPSNYVQSNSSAWMQSLGLNQTGTSGSLSDLLDLRVNATTSGKGMIIQGTPSAGDMGIRIFNNGTGGRKWMIDATNNSSSHYGGYKLVFLYYRSGPIIIPGSTAKTVGEQSDNSEQAVTKPPVVINPPEIIDDLYPTQYTWVDVLTLDGQNNRVGILDDSPSYTLDVTGNIRATSTITQNSDVHFKENIDTLENSLDKVLNLRGVHYDWKTQEFKDKSLPEGRQVGLIAQEVEQVVPEVVTTDDEGYKSIDYSRL